MPCVLTSRLRSQSLAGFELNRDLSRMEQHWLGLMGTSFPLIAMVENRTIIENRTRLFSDPIAGRPKHYDPFVLTR